VPNGVLVDEDGVIRFAKYGGFSIDRVEDVAAVERFVAGLDPGPSPAVSSPYQLDINTRELVATKLRLGRLLDSLGRRDEAIAEWRAALRLDPENLVIRKQIWVARHPEKFHPTIDWDWQRAKLATERAEEVAARICGPDGCPIPG
jgi:tetratricopeptide (TPR) repeat protein